MPELTDTIVAEATPPGRGSVRVIRISGSAAAALLGAAFVASGVGPVERPRRLCLGSLLTASGEVLDRALAVWFPGPRSLTGEDVAEIHVHGGKGIVRGGLECLERFGGRMALPGEFSYRAYLNGKLSLLEAEAVNALVEAEGAAQAVRIGGLSGRLGEELARLRSELLCLRADWEARIDFPEETEEGGPDRKQVEPLLEKLSRLEADGRAVRFLREGWRIALVGRVNTGKSSLFNALLKRDRALVTPHPGTTRDVIEESIEVGGYALVLQDTAGVRAACDPVEAAGVERSRETAGQADGTLFVYDAAEGWNSEDEGLLAELERPPLAILANKRDLPESGRRREGALRVSAKTGEGLKEVRDLLESWMERSLPRGIAALVSERQVEAVRRAADGCREAMQALEAGHSEEVALQELGRAQRAMDDLLGGGGAEELYDAIFSRFCIGK
ncbi:MAG: tRNA uridine-5-carboxymethylaminomethyl(34) synthesis GTPase MnmE [Acidobacteriota bacterium]